MKSIQQIYNAIFKLVCTVVVTIALNSPTLAQESESAGQSKPSLKEYKVELILFESLQTDPASEPHDYTPPQSMRSKAIAWQLEPSLLLEEAERLDQSADYVVRRHIAWGVESLPYRDSATYTVLERDTQGYIKVYADQLLFTNIDLEHKGFRMLEKRRLKLNEKHYFDHPKFGLLMQVSRLEEKTDETPATEGAE